MSEIYKLVQAIESYNESDLCLGTLRSLKKIKDAAAMLETELADKDRQLADARAEIERKDGLIEQMREALQWYKEQVSSCNRNGDAGELARDRLAKDVGKRADAALAAEGGE